MIIGHEPDFTGAIAALTGAVAQTLQGWSRAGRARSFRAQRAAALVIATEANEKVGLRFSAPISMKIEIRLAKVLGASA